MINNKILSQKEFNDLRKWYKESLDLSNKKWKTKIEKIKEKNKKCDITNATIDKICSNKEKI